MSRRKGLLFGFLIAAILIITVPLILGLVIGKDDSGQDVTQVRTEDKITLVFWNLYDSEDSFAGPAQTFFSANPGYKLEYLSFKDEEAYIQTLEKALSEGWGPDIFTLRGNSFFANKEKVSPIPSGTFGHTPETFKSIFVPSVVDQLILGDPGSEQIYGMPLFVDTLAIYYNKRYFQDFLPAQGRPAKYWAQIPEQVKALNKNDNSFERFARTGIALGRSDNISLYNEILGLMFLQLGTPIYSNDYTSTLFNVYRAKDPLTGDSFVPSERAIDVYTSFARPSFDNYSWNNLITKKVSPNNEVSVFVRGKTSMILGTSQTYKEIKSTMDKFRGTSSSTMTESNIGVAEIPQFTDQRRDALAITYPLFVSAKSKYKDAAFNFITFLSNHENSQYYLEKTGKPPARRDLIERFSTQSSLGVFAIQAGFAKDWPIPNWYGFSKKLDVAVNDILNQYASVREAVQTLGIYLNCELGIYNKNKNLIIKGCN